jgi:hypothetical protein
MRRALVIAGVVLALIALPACGGSSVQGDDCTPADPFVGGAPDCTVADPEAEVPSEEEVDLVLRCEEETGRSTDVCAAAVAQGDYP